ncbi:hypothetical protein BVRB_1g022310 isoform A [Beta vulgaris subsp. vulgaris]|nr:hypothetical protein BVRB_1g022310 isoform A [Beta vulgaris subsp. vulgaris]
MTCCTLMMDSTRPRCFRTSSPAIQSKCVIEHYKYNITKGSRPPIQENCVQNTVASLKDWLKGEIYRVVILGFPTWLCLMIS